MQFKKTRQILSIIIFYLIIFSLSFGSVFALTDVVARGKGIRIAVIDTGVLEEYDAFDNVEIIKGKNFVFTEEDTKDKIGHGTRVVSLITGVKTKYGSIEGLAPEAIIVPLVYQSKYPSGVIKNGGIDLLAEAIRTAIDEFDCKILCISSGTTQDNDVLREAIEYAEKKSVTIVAAVGNDNIKNPNNAYYPAAYETVIGIGAIDKNDKIAEFSQRKAVFAVTYGKDVTALSMDGKFKKFSGTSYATAYATGTIAALLSEHPNASPKDIRDAISISTNDLGENGYDSDYGWGKINLESAINVLSSILKEKESLNK